MVKPSTFYDPAYVSRWATLLRGLEKTSGRRTGDLPKQEPAEDETDPSNRVAGYTVPGKHDW